MGMYAIAPKPATTSVPKGFLVFLDGSRSAAPKRTVRTGASDDMAARLRAVADHSDRAAFADLFNHFAPRIKAFMAGRGCEPGLAEDIAQEAMVAVWRKAAMFDPGKASAATWIFTIARNLHIDRIRRENRPEPDPEDPFFRPEPETPADEVLSQRQMADGVRAALASLPPEQRDVISLAYFEDEAHSAIAEKLNIPLGTVKSRIRLAFGRLRDSLGGEE
jgi:RNA polymerase sigma-70 factor (ECF subfamily)